MTDMLSLRPGDAITRWAMAPSNEQYFPGTARPMPDRVDYQFVNGWVDTGDLPCREALLAIRQGNDTRSPDCPDAAFDSVHLTGESTDADFSQFCYRPTLIRHLLRCTLSGNGPARFDLSTCGGVRLWLDDDLVAQFQPFTRNIKQVREVTLPLVPDGATLTVELEDLHERDTTCFVSLILRAGDGVSTALPAADGLEHLDPTLAAMAALRLDRVFYTGGPMALVCDAPPTEPLPLAVTDIGPFPRGGIAGRSGHCPDVAITLSTDAPSAVICDSATAPQGCLAVTAQARVGKGTITRQLGTTVLSRATPLDQPTLAARKQAALAAILAEPSFEPSVALAQVAAGQITPGALAVIDRALTTIEERHDCCDFTMLPLLRLLRDHRAALPPETAERLHAAVLGFRYWLDGSGDDVMWFWSENHVACFHIAQLVAGTLFPTETFTNSGKSGATLAKEATARLHRWFDAISAHGLGEWNSAAYYPIDLLALLSLHDLTVDAALKARSADLMDQIFTMAGLHTTGGVPAGSQGRAYEKELLAGPATELGTVAAIAFGGGFVPGYSRAAALFCLSDYEPPALAKDLAQVAGTVQARYTQGTDHLGRLTLFKTPEVQLSTVSDHKTGQPGHQQHVIDVQCAAHPMARLWINHPGELKEWGERRPSLLAGNGHLPRVAQHGALAALIYDLPEGAIPFTQLFAPDHAFDATTTQADWTVFHAGAARVAIWCSTPLSPVTTGQYKGSLHRAAGRSTAWLVAVGGPDLVQRLGAPRFANGTVTAALDDDTFALPFDGPLLINGHARPFAPLSPIPHIAVGDGPLQPWTALAADETSRHR